MNYNEELKKFKENNPYFNHKEAVSEFKEIWVKLKEDELKDLSENISKTYIEEIDDGVEICTDNLEVIQEVEVKDSRQEALDFYYKEINGRTMFKQSTMNEFFTHWRAITGTKTIGTCSTCSNNFTKMVKIFKKKLGI